MTRAICGILTSCDAIFMYLHHADTYISALIAAYENSFFFYNVCRLSLTKKLLNLKV